MRYATTDKYDLTMRDLPAIEYSPDAHAERLKAVFWGGKFSLQSMIIDEHKSLSCDYRLFIDWPIPIDNN